MNWILENRILNSSQRVSHYFDVSLDDLIIEKPDSASAAKDFSGEHIPNLLFIPDCR
jgi:hypothetical protein